MYTVIESIDKDQIIGKFKLPGENNICDPVESVVKKDDGSVVGFVLLEHDQKLIAASEMNELIQKQGICFDTPDEYFKWKDKNPWGLGELDEMGNYIPPKSTWDKLKGWLGF